jgi:hypothetical protein
MKRGVPAVALVEWQENTVNNIDIGLPISNLEVECPNFDWSPMFPAREGLYEFSQEALAEWGIVARELLEEWNETVVVSQDGIMRRRNLQQKIWKCRL